MALDPYTLCPCGSGKKFKWCCQDIHGEIEKAYEQDQNGQHEVALRTMDEVAAAHPTNPEVWGRKAEMLYRNGRPDDAEAALQKAFDLNPKYPFGYLLQGTFRQAEGELPGAVLLFRKAAELFDPNARDQLGNIYALIAQCEVRLNRPVAARAALRIASHLLPANEEIRQTLDGFFGEKSQLPLAARREYHFLAPGAMVPPDRRAGWDQALNIAATGRLGDAARAFEQLTLTDPTNPVAWFNLGLCRAWLGENRPAIEALDSYVGLEPDLANAAAAWALAEVLRLGDGLEEVADYIEYSFMLSVRDPQPVSACLQEWQNQNRLIVMQAEENQPVLSAWILEPLPPSLIPGAAPTQLPHLDASLMIVRDRLRLWGSNPEGVRRVRDELLRKTGVVPGEGSVEQAPANFADVLAPAIVIPVNLRDPQEAEAKVRAAMASYFEEKWLHQPLKALNGVAPIDAVGHPTLRKKVAGVVEFLAQSAALGHQPYDFARLRHKLGLETAAAADTAAAKSTAAAGPDIGAMSVPDLVQLPLETLDDDQLERAYQAALQLAAPELAGRFAVALVGRPPRPERPDRFPWYSHLIQLALSEKNTEAALTLVGEGESADREQNEGRRGPDYAVRRGQLHARRGETQAAKEAFDRLIAMNPKELRYHGAAAEAMLSAKQPELALGYAEAALTVARAQNQRDPEAYFGELAEAARKQARS
jgi:tetratricopeptide (TPR) repeat protein